MTTLFCLLALGVTGGIHAAELEIATRLVVPPGNITITPEGRQIISLHQFYSPKNRVVEIAKDGSLKPFPNAAFNQPDNDPLGIALDSVLGLQSDSEGVVWMLDNGLRGNRLPKIVAWDTRKERLVRVIYLPPPAVLPDSFLNDLAVDLIHGAIFITDTATGNHSALVVVNLATGVARRVLQGHLSLVAEDIDLTVDGRVVEMKSPEGELKKLRGGANPIALDPLSEWLYFGPMSSKSLYRIRAKDLADMTIPVEVLPERVERFCDKPICDGITIDKAANIYLGDIGANAIGRIVNHRYEKIVTDENLSWPDAFAISPDGWLYIVANQIQRSPKMNDGKDLAELPFLLFRMKIDAAAPGKKPGANRPR